MTEQLELLHRASAEIKQLRNENHIMRAKLDVFDSCMMLLTSQVRGSNVASTEDVAWQIDKFIANQESNQQEYPKPLHK